MVPVCTCGRPARQTRVTPAALGLLHALDQVRRRARVPGPAAGADEVVRQFAGLVAEIVDAAPGGLDIRVRVLLSVCQPGLGNAHGRNPAEGSDELPRPVPYLEIVKGPSMNPGHQLSQREQISSESYLRSIFLTEAPGARIGMQAYCGAFPRPPRSCRSRPCAPRDRTARRPAVP